MDVKLRSIDHIIRPTINIMENKNIESNNNTFINTQNIKTNNNNMMQNF